MPTDFDHEMGKRGLLGMDVEIPKSQAEHDSLKKKGYSHGHWMFKGNETPKFVLNSDKDGHDKLAEEGWSNELYMYSADGGDFHLVRDKEHFLSCRKMGFSGVRSTTTSGPRSSQ